MADRPITKVMDAILNVVPDSEPVKPQLVAAFDRLKRICGNTAPEIMVTRWADLSVILTEILGDPQDADWKQKASNIVTDKLDYLIFLK